MKCWPAWRSLIPTSGGIGFGVIRQASNLSTIVGSESASAGKTRLSVNFFAVMVIESHQSRYRLSVVVLEFTGTNLMRKSRFLRTLLLAAVIVGGIWALVHRDQIRRPSDAFRLLQAQIGSVLPAGTDTVVYTQPNAAQNYDRPNIQSSGYRNHQNRSAQLPNYSQSARVSANRLPSQPSNVQQVANPQTDGVVRLAVFKLTEKAPYLKNDEPVRLVAEICRQYDVVALQNISRTDTTWIKRITDLMNQMGAVGTQHQLLAGQRRMSSYVAISDRSHRSGQTQTVIIFNQQTVQLDHSKWYVVDDPDGMFKHDPMVAWFRCLGAPAQEAFTFTLACLEIDNEQPAKELQQLGTLMRAIRTDGRGEDDVILLGDFQADDRGLDAIRHQAGLSWVLSNRFTNVQQNRQFDNIVFSETPTTEFTGRGGVIDFIQKYGLRDTDGSALALRLPIWAEFSIYENGRNGQQPQIPGRIAARSGIDQPADR